MLPFLRAHNCALSLHLCDVPPPRLLPLRHLVLHEEQDCVCDEQRSNKTQRESAWNSKTSKIMFGEFDECRSTHENI